MSEKTPSYTVVRELSIENLTESAKGNSQANIRVKRTGSTCWAQTVLFINEAKPLADFDETQDAKELAEELRDTFKTAFMDEYEGDYDEGKNARTGKTMNITDAKGEVKWSSWEMTRLPISYATDLAQVLAKGLLDDLIDTSGKHVKVLDKADAMRACKDAESPMATIEKALALVETKYAEVTDTEQATAMAMVEDLSKRLAAFVAKAA